MLVKPPVVGTPASTVIKIQDEKRNLKHNDTDDI